MSRLNRVAISIFLGTVLSGCNSPSTGPSFPDHSGSYKAAMLRLLVGGDVTEDMLGIGGTLNLTLNDDSTFTGHLHLPAPWAPFWNDTSEYNLDLTGRWSRTFDDEVLLKPFAQSFFSSATLATHGDTLTGSILTDDLPDNPFNEIFLQFDLVRTVDEP